MQALAITSIGIEDVAAKEIQELINSKSSIDKSVIQFKVKKLEEICLVAYKAQSINRVMFLLDKFKFSNDPSEILETKMLKYKLKEWLTKKKFDIQCIRQGEHEFSSADIEIKLKNKLAKGFKKSFDAELDYNNPDIIILIYIVDEKIYLGLDFSGFDLYKRQYKIFPSPDSLRGPLAYSLLRLTSFKENSTFLDPFVGDGVIAIEAALFSSKFPVRHYSKDKFLFKNFNQFKDFNFKSFYSKLDKKQKTKTNVFGFAFHFKNVDATKKNAKIAGVLDNLKLSRVELSWLDLKFKEKSVDCIATKIPNIKHNNEKILHDFFNQTEYILNEKGKIGLITYPQNSLNIIKTSKEFKFRINHQRTILSGQQPLEIIILEKSTKS